MKTLIKVLLLAVLPSFAMADNVPGIIITKTDGSKVTVDISTVKSIKFRNGEMLITRKSSDSQSVALEEVSTMTFGSIASAINLVTASNKNTLVTVSDMSGKILYQGKACNYTQPNNLKGTYIIATSGKSHKVTIK